jgi:hypothetical protein
MVFPDFPNSSHEEFIITSPEDRFYNCIAWAYGIPDRWLWPSQHTYWPSNIPLEVTLDAFILLFRSIGYEACANDDFEYDYEKVAIYIDSNGVPTHAARQRPNGLWTSKLGMSFDVSHTLFGMSDGVYGNVGAILKREIKLRF